MPIILFVDNGLSKPRPVLFCQDLGARGPIVLTDKANMSIVSPEYKKLNLLNGDGLMPEAEALKIIETYFKGFNAHDNDIYFKTHHFPHIRINDAGLVSIIREASKFLPLDAVLAQLADTEGWHHSTLDFMEVIHASEHKMHVNIRFSRYKADGTKYGEYQSLWILTKKDNLWGIQARSSYAP